MLQIFQGSAAPLGPALHILLFECRAGAGLDKQVEKIISTGGFAVGFPFWDMTNELKTAFENTDFIVSKGMGNFECFTETNYKPLAYLMRIKCIPIAEASGAPLRSSVAIVVE